MSLREPNRPTPNDHVRQVLDQLRRATTATGRPAAPFMELCDRASIPRDLRTRLLARLVAERYVTREGDLVHLTEAGRQAASAPPAPPSRAPAAPPPPFDREARVRLPGSGTRQRRGVR
ncbi:MAG TPA: hypothetical protein VFL91_02385 [Thermomicrobiales bacterium]|nr:hypothetical protein [Thermomicrobiales bacterium]